MNRKEHLEWAKERAIGELEYSPGDAGITNAWASIVSDLGKHEETQDHPAIMLGTSLLMTNNLNTQDKMRDFIEGFN